MHPGHRRFNTQGMLVHSAAKSNKQLGQFNFEVQFYFERLARIFHQTFEIEYLKPEAR